MSLQPLTQCGVCSKIFTNTDFPALTESLVFTFCSHIFHQACLGGWVNISQKPCPLCKAVVYKHQAGKDFTVYWDIFLKALKLDPEIVRSTLEKSEHKNSVCSVGCLEDLPLIPLRYDASKKQLVHDACDGTNLPSLLMQDLSQIVAKIVKKDPDLQRKFTPTPPTFFQRMRTDHPLLFRVVVIGSVSLSALLFNRYKYDGESWILFTLSLPAYLTLVITQQVGLLIIALLNAQQRPI